MGKEIALFKKENQILLKLELEANPGVFQHSTNWNAIWKGLSFQFLSRTRWPVNLFSSYCNKDSQWYWCFYSGRKEGF